MKNRRWLRNSDQRIRRIYENLEPWAKDEIALLCDNWSAYEISHFHVTPYSLLLTAASWNDGVKYLVYAAAEKRLIIRPKLLKIAETDNYGPH